MDTLDKKSLLEKQIEDEFILPALEAKGLTPEQSQLLETPYYDGVTLYYYQYIAARGYDLDIKHPNAVQEEILEAPPIIIAQVEKDLADLVALVGRMKNF